VTPEFQADEFGGAGSGFKSHKGRDAANQRGGSLPRDAAGGGSPEYDKAKAYNHQVKKDIILQDVEQQGYSTNKIFFPEGRPAKQIGDDYYETLADMNQQTGEIRVYEGALSMSAGRIKGVMAHELNHAAFDNGAIAQGIQKNVGVDAWNEEAWAVMKAKDGVTPYSTLMWEKGGWNNLAVRETLAEIARLEQMGQMEKVDPLWQSIYRDTQAYIKERG
jgi:hypothetical protein